jgi:hypothetical protein
MAPKKTVVHIFHRYQVIPRKSFTPFFNSMLTSTGQFRSIGSSFIVRERFGRRTYG